MGNKKMILSNCTERHATRISYLFKTIILPKVKPTTNRPHKTDAIEVD